MPRTLVAACLAAAFMPLPATAADEDKIDCENALSTYEMNICAGRAFEVADARLNAVYKNALAAIPELATGEKPFDARSWEAALRASQRAWIAFRDAECEEHVAMFWSGGSGATVDIIGCQTEKTEARTKELSERYEIE